MEPVDFYHHGSRQLQNAFGTGKLADHLARQYVLGQLEPEHVKWIAIADAVLVASVSPAGNPECSYKGGLPGFITVPDPRTIEIPSYDGNGMYRTLGNAAAIPRVQLLFLLPSVPAKLRVSGTCTVSRSPEVLARHPGAEAVLLVTASEVFENCPRYLHDPATGEHSVHCPRPEYEPPEPAWKQKPEYEGLLPSRPTEGAS